MEDQVRHRNGHAAGAPQLPQGGSSMRHLPAGATDRSGSRRWPATNCCPTPVRGPPTRSRSWRRRQRGGPGWCRWAGAGPGGTPTAGSTGCCSRPTAPAPLGSCPSTSGWGRATGSQTAPRRGLLVHRGAARAGPAAGAAVDQAPAGVLASARVGDGVDLELAPGRAGPWADPGHSAQSDAPGPVVVRAGIPGRGRPGGLRHGPQPPARPPGPGRGRRFVSSRPR